MSDHGEEKAIEIARKAARQPYDRHDCFAAKNQARESKITLKVMLETVYPVGIRVIAKLGGHKVKVEISGHSHAEDGELSGFNVKTGAMRKFNFSLIQEVVI